MANAPSPPSPPGSPAAIANGCTCPVIDNARGKGVYGDGDRYGWWVSADCPLHGEDKATGDAPD